MSVYVTVPDAQTAKRLARELLDARLVACANLWPIASLYRWEGAIHEDAEVAMLLKTRASLVPEVERALRASHPYQVPCVVAWPIVEGSAPYLAWVAEETKAEAPKGN